jgi:hypothetical protein
MSRIEYNESLPPCDAEIGKTGHYHQCGRPAHVFSQRRINDSVFRLYFCKRHADRATARPESHHVSIDAIGEVKVWV